MGITSFDVVARVRKAVGLRRVGHAGTLDPLATGVLLVCLGQATRIVSYLQDADKVYLAGIQLGRLTSTYDSEGEITREVPVPEKLELSQFIGEIWQTPPIYSALKREGKPLYAYARAGQEVAIEPRLVTVYSIDLVEWRPPFAALRVRCGKGTYIRSLANDLGGHLTSLVREAVGGFRVEDALSLDQLASWENKVVPIEAALADMPRQRLDADQARRVTNGLPVDAPTGESLALDPDGRALAILDGGKPHIVFGAG